MIRQVLLALIFCLSASAATFTAADCNRTSVNNIVNGPTHVAVNGDEIVIPAGACSWTAGITVPAGVGIYIHGTGTPNSLPSQFTASASCTQTVITLTGSTASLFRSSPARNASLMRISCMELIRGAGGATPSGPIATVGTCDISGCPGFRMDNITATSSWVGNGAPDGTFLAPANVFGVADHNQIGDTVGSGIGLIFVNPTYPSWQGVGDWGDNSWASPDSFGTNQAFYIENNTSVYGLLTETDWPLTGAGGGARQVCRFNIAGITSGGGCGNHGTETTGRARGNRHYENYANSYTCRDTAGCGSIAGGRSAYGPIFGNTGANGGGNLKNVTVYDNYRSWRGDTQNMEVFGQCPIPPATTLTGVTFACPSPSAFDNRGTSAANTACMDMPTRGGGGVLLQGSGGLCDTSSISIASGGTPIGGKGPLNQPLDPTYEMMDNLPSTVTNGGALIITASSITGMIQNNRDYYQETLNQSAQTSPSSPFNGTSGTGHGTLANRPTSCTLNPGTGPNTPADLRGVGYFATDVGNWNQSGQTYAGGVSQGELFVCMAVSTAPVGTQFAGSSCTATTNGHFWCPYYEPFTYPHPLVTQSASAAALTVAPTNVSFGNVQVGANSSTQTITISNPGGVPGTISTMSGVQGTPFSGTNAGDFSLISQTCGLTLPVVLASGASCSATIRVTPGAVGTRNANFNVTDAPDSLSASATLSANGIIVTHNYWVSTTGSDSNTCAQADSSNSPSASPKATIQSAYNCATPGDTITVENGTYTNNGVTGPLNYVTTLTISGTSGSTITIKAQNTATDGCTGSTCAVLDSGNTNSGTANTTCTGAGGYFLLQSIQYVNISGFHITRACAAGIQANSSASNISITKNVIDHIGDYGQSDYCTGDAGIFIGPSGGASTAWTIDSNIFHDIGRTADSCFAPDHDHGISYYATASNITNNVFYNLVKGWGVQVNPGSTGSLIAFNTFDTHISNGADAGVIRLSMDTTVSGANLAATIENNIAYQPTTSLLGFFCQQGGSSCPYTGTLDYDLAYGTTASGAPTGLTVGAHNLLGITSTFNPDFTNPGSHLYTLTSPSPAISAGVALSVTHDLLGVTRANPPSLGAYEFISAPCTQNQAVGSYTLCGEAYRNISSGASNTVSYSPAPGNAIIVWATWCYESTCTTSTAGVTATIGDNINNPETNCTPSPNSPFVTNANGQGQGAGDFQEHYVWFCPSIPAGVTSFTVTPSLTTMRNIQINVSEWKAGALATSCSPVSNCFESVDNLGVAGNTTGGTTATITTSGATTNANDLIFVATGVPCCSFTSSAGAGYTGITVAPSVNIGLVSEAAAATTTGIKSGTTTWTGGNAAWFGVIVPIKAAGATPAPSIQLTPGSLNFTSQNVGTTSSIQTFQVANVGNADLTLTAVSASGDFTLSGGTCSSVPITITSGANCTIGVTFSPLAIGNRSGSVSITDNASGSPHSVTLSGTGANGVVLSLTTNSTCGNSNVGVQASCNPILTLQNNGTATATLSSIVKGGTNSTSFAFTTTCGGTLAPTISCTITPTMTPTIGGPLTANITVTDTPDSQTAIANLTGTGISPTNISVLQFKACTSGLTWPGTCLFNNPTTAGSLIHVVLPSWNNAGTTPTITACSDSVSDSFTLSPANYRSTNTNTGIGSFNDGCYASNGAGGATGVTVTTSVPIQGDVFMWEVKNANTFDHAASLSTQAATATPTSAPLTLAGSTEIILTVIHPDPAGQPNALVAANPFTLDQCISGSCYGHLITNATGTYSMQVQGSSAKYSSSSISFMPAAPSVNTPAGLLVKGAVQNGTILGH